MGQRRRGDGRLRRWGGDGDMVADGGGAVRWWDSRDGVADGGGVVLETGRWCRRVSHCRKSRNPHIATVPFASLSVLDCFFSTDVLGDDKHRDYVESAVIKMRYHWPDGSFTVFNFMDGENCSQIVEILSEHGIEVMEYHTQHENCPLLEMIHHFLILSETWLDLRESNILLLHCERDCWPVLAFSLAALLVYRKHCAGEQRTLDMVYKYAPPELLQLVLEMNPVPS